jgi:hypothetical protein
MTRCPRSCGCRLRASRVGPKSATEVISTSSPRQRSPRRAHSRGRVVGRHLQVIARASWRRRAVCGAALRAQGRVAARPLMRASAAPRAGPTGRPGALPVMARGAASRRSRGHGPAVAHLVRARAPLVGPHNPSTRCVPGEGCVAFRDHSERCTTVALVTLTYSSRRQSRCPHLLVGASARSRVGFARFRAEALIMPPGPPSVAPRTPLGRPPACPRCCPEGRRGSPVEGRRATPPLMTGEGWPRTLRGATEGPMRQEHQAQERGVAGLDHRRYAFRSEGPPTPGRSRPLLRSPR